MCSEILTTHIIVYLSFVLFIIIFVFLFFPICFDSMEYVALQPYSEQVLIGNWFDRRFGSDGKGNGILPGQHSTERCEQHRTLNQDSYSDAGYKGEEPISKFKKQRGTFMTNYKAGTTSNVRLLDGQELLNNYTTTNTLLYDWLPQLRQQHMMKVPQVGPPKHQPELDLLQAYGNMTKTHSWAQRKKCQIKLDKRYNMTTTYTSSYNSLNCKK